MDKDKKILDKLHKTIEAKSKLANKYAEKGDSLSARANECYEKSTSVESEIHMLLDELSGILSDRFKEELWFPDVTWDIILSGSDWIVAPSSFESDEMKSWVKWINKELIIFQENDYMKTVSSIPIDKDVWLLKYNGKWVFKFIFQYNNEIYEKEPSQLMSEFIIKHKLKITGSSIANAGRYMGNLSYVMRLIPRAQRAVSSNVTLIGG